MTVRLNEERLEANESSPLADIVRNAKERCRERGEVLVQIVVNGNALSQAEWEELADEALGEKDVDLISEPKESISKEVVKRALSYLDDLMAWVDEHDWPDDERVEQLEELVEGLGWLNAAIEGIDLEDSGQLIVDGQPLARFHHQSGLFLAELQGALEDCDHNRELLNNLLNRELPTWLERYKSTFNQLNERLEGDHFD